MKLYIAVFELIDPMTGFLVPLANQYARTGEKALELLRKDLNDNEDLPDWVRIASKEFLGFSFNDKELKKVLKEVNGYKFGKSVDRKSLVSFGEHYHVAIFEENI